jgi:hypothetical protein
MPSKKYSPASQESGAKASLVREAKAQRYGRGENRRRGSQLGLSVAAVKRRLKKPVQRSESEIAWALEIAGIGEGPRDLSKKTREYLSGDK